MLFLTKGPRQLSHLKCLEKFTIQMAARRSLGGGRVLGSGRSLEPAAALKQQQQQHSRNTSLLTPSESSVSLSSQTSSTPVSTENEDILSRVALEEHGPSAAASASSRLVCPICNEEMVSFLRVYTRDISPNVRVDDSSPAQQVGMRCQGDSKDIACLSNTCQASGR